MKFTQAAVLILSFGLLACAELPLRPEVRGQALSVEEKNQQLLQVQDAQAELDQLHFQKSLEMFQKFKLAHLNSPFFQKAQIGEAKSFSGIGKWSEAAEIYRDVVESSRKYQPELAAEALYELSFCYESLGDDAKTTASLLDAERMKEYLPQDVAKAELPARLAGNYYRLGQSKESAAKLAEAESGLQELRVAKGEALDKNWLGKIYYVMGYVSTNQLSFENFKLTLESLQVVQKFSLLSMEQQSENWSALAAESLKQSYRDLVQLTDQIPLNKALDRGAAIRQQSDQKAWMAGLILQNIQKLKLLRNPEKNDGNYAKDFFASLAVFSEKLNQQLSANPTANTLTSESLQLQNLKKNFKIKLDPSRDQLFPVEMGQEK